MKRHASSSIATLDVGPRFDFPAFVWNSTTAKFRRIFSASHLQQITTTGEFYPRRRRKGREAEKKDRKDWSRLKISDKSGGCPRDERKEACAIFQRRFTANLPDDLPVVPLPRSATADKPSFLCNFRGRFHGNPREIHDPTESVLLSRRVTRVPSSFVAFPKPPQSELSGRVVSSSRRPKHVNKIATPVLVPATSRAREPCHFVKLERISAMSSIHRQQIVCSSISRSRLSRRNKSSYLGDSLKACSKG